MATQHLDELVGVDAGHLDSGNDQRDELRIVVVPERGVLAGDAGGIDEVVPDVLGVQVDDRLFDGVEDHALHVLFSLFSGFGSIEIW